MTTVISADQHLWLWAFVMTAATAAIYLEQTATWAKKIPGAVIALIIAIIASNLRIIPTDAPVYDAVWSYIVPLAIPLLLFQLPLRKIFQESGRLLFLFLLSSFGTVIGALLAFFALRSFIPELDKITGIITASYTGGGVNFAAMSAKLEPSETMISATTVADNLMMAVYFLILISVAAMPLVQKIWGKSELPSVSEQVEDYWQAKPVSLQNIAFSLASAISLVAISFAISKFLKQTFASVGIDNAIVNIIFELLSDKYLLLTTLTIALILSSPKLMQKCEGSQELGTYAIYLFFVVIGIPADIPLIIKTAPLLFVFTFIIAVVNLIFTLGSGKLFKFKIEEIVLCCNANIGGPTTAAALAIGQGWRSLVGPILIIGTTGYIIGNYLGALVFMIIS